MRRSFTLTDFKYNNIRKLLYPLEFIYKLYRKYLLSDKMFIKNQFHLKHGYKIDLRKPTTLNEKIQWLKLFDRTPYHTLCADKLAVRDYVKEIVGEAYLIPLVFKTKYPKNINEDNLPDFPVIVKANHNSGGNIIVMNKSSAEFSQIQKRIKKWLSTNYFYHAREWQYKHIKRCLLVEKLLLDDGEVPNDYKFHCFNGKVEFIQIDIDRFDNHKRNFYTREWEKMPFTWSPHVNNNPIWPNGKDVEKPEKLDELINVAEKLSKQFIYVRIDLYLFQNDIYFGEITFHHGNGHEIFVPEKWDLFFGEKINLGFLDTN